jgi:hypothetical protein
MSFLSSVTSILELIKIPRISVPQEGRNPTKLDDGGAGKQSEWNDDHKGDPKNGDKDDYSKLCEKDDYSKHGKDDYSKDGKGDYSKHDVGWKDAKSDDCQPQKDYCESKPPDDFGKGDTYRNPGEALAEFDFSHGDFSHGDFGPHGPDHSGDIQSALASMSSDDALEYAIGQMGPADHIDVGHFDVAADTSHDTDA